MRQSYLANFAAQMFKMKISSALLLSIAFLLFSCQQQLKQEKPIAKPINNAKYAKGFTLVNYGGYSILEVKNPWPAATKNYKYVLQSKASKLPDSLSSFPIVQVPVRSIVVTSTTHIPSLEMLGVENSLVGFPMLDYISSVKVRDRIDQKKVRELGSNQSLNTEVILDLNPDVIVGYGIDNNNPALDNLERSGLKILLNGDWNEETPLGKAEWIKFFGALYGLESKADSLFQSVEKSYLETLQKAKSLNLKPSVMAGALYENRWYLPYGNSWGAQLIAEAGGDYLWSSSKGTGSLSLPFESVYSKALDADFWIGPAQFTSLAQMVESNPHYAKFKAFRNKNVYTFSSKKGKTGGVIYYELAPNRPDLVIKDLVKILHPDLFPDYELYFFEKLK